MKYIDFAENERLSTIVLGMMRISQMSEDEVEALVEAALSIGINHLIWRIFMEMDNVSTPW